MAEPRHSRTIWLTNCLNIFAWLIIAFSWLIGGIVIQAAQGNSGSESIREYYQNQPFWNTPNGYVLIAILNVIYSTFLGGMILAASQILRYLAATAEETNSSTRLLTEVRDNLVGEQLLRELEQGVSSGWFSPTLISLQGSNCS